MVAKGGVGGVNGRIVSTSTDEGGSWSQANVAADLQPSTPCEGSTLGVGSTLYTALPHSVHGRYNMSIFASNDNGTSWRSVAQQYAGASFYSSLAVSPPATVNAGGGFGGGGNGGRTLYNLVNVFNVPGWPNPPDGNHGGLALIRMALH